MRATTIRAWFLLFPLAGLLTSNDAAALSNPDDFCTGNPCIISSAKTADAGVVLDFGTRDVRLTEILTIANLPSGNVGSLTILAGSFTIINDGQIKGVNGTHQAGTVNITTTGDIRLDGTRSNGAIRLNGADGGNLELAAGGSVFASGRINLDHEGLPAGGGALTITTFGDVQISGDIIAEGGVQGFGGSIDIQAGGNIDISGQIDISGGESGGGFLDIFGFASVDLGPIEMSAGGDAGDAGLGDITAIGSITLHGLVRGNGADNGENCGDAGDIDITADADITISGPVEMKGRGLDCSGGFLAVDGDVVTITGNVDLSGTGTEGFGGDVDIASSSTMLITGPIDVGGGDGAGDLLVSADGNLSVLANITANGRTSISTGSSLLELDSGGALLLAGQIDARGGALGGGGDVSLDACSVTTSAGTVIRTDGPGGLITVLGTDSITLAGQFFGEPTTPVAIEVRFGPGANPPNLAAATFNVAPTLVLNPLAIPCALCLSSAECNDNNGCTDDVCVPATGCQNNPNTAPCNDDNLCTVGDVCSAGACLGGAAASCNDGNVCTTDLCVPASGCQNPPNSNPCDDGSVCTTGDQCSAGTCTGALLDCDDSDSCTDDSCLPISGCQNEPVANCGDADNDGIPDGEDPCTTLDWTATPLKPPDQNPGLLRLNLSGLAAPGEQKVLLKGFFNVADPAQTVAPETNGIHLVLADSAGVVYEVNVPGGALGAPEQCDPRDGWSGVSGPKTRWKYSNKSNALPPACAPGSARGLQSIQMKDLRSASKSALQVKLKAKHADFDRPLVTPPTLLRADIALAAQPSAGVASQQAIDGQCAEAIIEGNPIATAAPAPFCKIKLAGGALNKLTCKGL